MPQDGYMHPIDSTFISHAGWFTDVNETGWLRVRFRKDGAECEYQIPRTEYDIMMADPRPGNYFRHNIYRAGVNWRRV